MLDRLDPGDLDIIERALLPWAKREHRRRRRDRLIIELAGLYLGRLASGRAIAGEMAADLARFRPRPWPETGKRKLLAAILQLGKGKPLGKDSIRDILAGKHRRQSATTTAIIGR